VSLSGCSSLFSLSSTSTSRDNDSAAAAPVPPPPPSLHPLPPGHPLLSLSVGGGGEEEQEDEEEYLLGGLDLQLTGAGGSNSSGCCDGDDERKNIRMMKHGVRAPLQGKEEGRCLVCLVAFLDSLEK